MDKWPKTLCPNCGSSAKSVVGDARRGPARYRKDGKIYTVVEKRTLVCKRGRCRNKRVETRFGLYE